MELLIILVLILLNGVFAMAEIAVVSSRKARLELSARKGDKAAKQALKFAEHPSRFLSTVQIGITLIGIFLGIYSGEKIQANLRDFLAGIELFAPYANTLSIAIILVILTFFSLVLGELVPKRIGLVMPERIARLIALPMYGISLVAAPFIWLLTASTDLIVRLLGVERSRQDHITEEEIKSIIQEATTAGEVQEIEQDIVENVFFLGDRKVNTIMTQRRDIDWLDINDPDETNKKVIAETVHKTLPVCDGDLDQVLGIVHAKDLLNGILLQGEFALRPHLKPSLFFPENTSAYKALDKLTEAGSKMAMIVDEYGSVQGLLTVNDLVDMIIIDFERQLHDKKEIVPREDGSYLVDGTLPLAEFIRYFEIEMPDDRGLSQVQTVGGLAILIGKEIPRVGYKFTWKNLSIEIMDMDGRRIDKLLVREVE